MAGEDPIVAGMAGRYATALFELAKEQDALQSIESDLAALHKLISESDDLERLVKSPVFSAQDQATAISAVAEKANWNALTSNFLKLVAQNRRLFATQDIVKAFQALAARDRGEVTAQVTSAEPLSDEQTSALKSGLKETIGRDVQIEQNVDPALLGGLIVKVGSRMIDNSLKTKLNNLKLAMKEVG